MNPSQPPLINGEPILPGPVFTPRPGWGGQLKHWFKENAYLVVFRSILLAAIALIVASLVREAPQTATLLPTPTPTATTGPDAGHLQSAHPGEGLSHLAARALDEHLARHPEYTLTPAQHLAAVDTLSRAKGLRRLKLGEQVTFSHDEVASAVVGSLALSAAALAMWSRYLRP